MQRVLTLARSGTATWPLTLEAERDRLVLWLPVLMGSGVVGYFAVRAEPPLWLGTAMLLPALAGSALAGAGTLMRCALLAIAAISFGLTSAQFATWRAAPLLTLPRNAVTVTGTVREVDPLQAGRRIWLDSVRLDGGPPLPRSVRVRLRASDATPVGAGDEVRLRALLRPPSAPAYPGGWDFQRDAFYTGLGGSGFSLGPIQRVSVRDANGLAQRLQRLRATVAARFRAGIPGPAGSIAATLFTGMSHAIPEADHAAFRDSGLAHLLAVAGLHIGIVMGWILLLARRGLALSGRAALFWPCKQIAALAAIVAGGCYMVLTGMHVPIVRSFAMATLYTLGVLLGRRAISLRGLGVAACVMMLAEPQEVAGVSFQMSFAAVLALIAGYDALRPWLLTLRGQGRGRRIALHLAMLALTSLLAGTASAPFGAYHFGRVQTYFVFSNMLAVPLTALWVMPLGLVALALMPFGIERVALMPMGWGVEAILWVARATASLPWAVLPVPHPPIWGLVVTALGMAWLGLWASRIRLAGIVVVGVGLASPWIGRPADILVSADARLIGVRTAAGALVAQAPGAPRFLREDWSDYWGVGRLHRLPLVGEAADGAAACDTGGCLLRPRATDAAALLVRGLVSAAQCRQAVVIVSAEPARGRCPKPWPMLVDRFTVWRWGPVAIWLRPNGARIVTDRDDRGSRPWVVGIPVRRVHLAVPHLPMAPAEATAPPPDRVPPIETRMSD
jgi:competence protein ComEC